MHGRANCAGETGDVEPQFVAEWNLWHIHFCRAEHRRAERWRRS